MPGFEPEILRPHTGFSGSPATYVHPITVLHWYWCSVVFLPSSLLYIFRVAYAICLLFFLYRIFLQYNKILNELHSPLKSYEYTYHTTSLFFHIYSKGSTGISILYYIQYGYVYDQKFVETKSFLKNVFLRLLFGESDSPRFYNFCVRQFMEAARFGHHSLLFAFFVYFLAFLGMQLKRNTHIKSEKRTEMNCRTKKL